MLVKKDPLNLTGKVAVITGGSSGIGLGVCELLSAYGAKIAMVDISPKGEEKAQELRDAGRDAAFFQCDVTNEEQVKARWMPSLQNSERSISYITTQALL